MEAITISMRTDYNMEAITQSMRTDCQHVKYQRQWNIPTTPFLVAILSLANHHPVHPHHVALFGCAIPEPSPVVDSHHFAINGYKPSCGVSGQPRLHAHHLQDAQC